MSVLSRLGWIGSRLLLAVTILVLGAGVFLTQTPPGKKLVFREVLKRVEGSIQGTIRVEEVSSSGFLRGIAFRGVVIRDPDGRLFLSADSLRLGISPLPLLGGNLVFEPVMVYGTRVVLEQLPGRDELNVVAIFASEEEAPSPTVAPSGIDTAAAAPDTVSRGADSVSAPGDTVTDGEGGGRTIILRDVRIVDGHLEILLPLPEEDRASDRVLVTEGPGGTRLRRMSFEELNLEMSEAVLSREDLEGERFRVESLSLRGRIFPRPFRVEDMKGVLRRRSGEAIASLEALELPSSTVEDASVEVGWEGEAGLRLEARGSASPLVLSDLQWIEPRLPAAEVTGPVGLTMAGDSLLLRTEGTDLALDGGEVRARGRIALAPEIAFRDLALDMETLPLSVVDPWLQDSLPLRGRLGGRLELHGGLDDLTLDSDLTFRDAGRAGTTRARVSGTLHLQEALGATDLNVTLAPMEWGTLNPLSSAMKLRGPGSLRMEASGTLAEGLDLSVEATHTPGDLTPSRVTLEGSLWRREGDVFLDLTGDLRPLSLTALRRSYEELPLAGELQGEVSVRGPLSDLVMETELETSAGALSAHARFDASNPLDGFSFDAETGGFLLSELVPGLPEPTRVSGRLLASGHGPGLDSLQGETTLFLRGGEVGELRVDSAAVVARVEDGLLQVDALTAETNLGTVEGGGSFGLASEAPSGELRLRVESESLTGLQPFLMGDVPPARDTLEVLERDALVFEGVDVDTLPTLEEVQVDGALEGSAVFRGGLRDFSGEGSFSFQDLRYRRNYVEEGEVTFSARGLPGEDRRIEATVRTDSLRAFALSFQEGQAEVELGSSGGRVQAAALRTEDEDYRVRGTFEVDSLGAGGRVHLDELTMRFDTARWNLGGPATVAWDSLGLRVRDFRFVRPGAERMRIRADGYLPLGHGEADFDLEVEELSLARLARVAQRGDSLRGIVGLELRVRGPTSAPRMEGAFRVRELEARGLSLDRLSSEFQYQERRISGEILASVDGREVLSATGEVPADLRLQEVEDRIPEAPVNVTMSTDSFPVGLALSWLETLEDVEGVVSGEVEVGGTPGDLEPSGSLRMVRGAFSLPAMGVRLLDIETGVEVQPDATLVVDGSLRSGEGEARVDGTVRLDPLSEPRFDLDVELDDFRAASRRDVRATLSGSLTVDSTYSRPFIQGDLTVEEGVLMVEEFTRSAGVVDLADPAFMDMDTTLAALEPIIRASRNPFLQNLRLDVAVEVGRGSWLRGRDLNVEMGGNLQVFWDRTERELVLVGEIEAIRGIYSVLGRQFQVQEGMVNFLGTPGINPSLDLQASNRIRTAEGERLEIIANVTGTLQAPRISLGSDAAFPISESDLVSYLVFGRPTYALASGQSAFAEGAAGSLLGAAAGAGVTLGLGTLGTQLGSLATRGIGLDYLAITQGQDVNPFGTSSWAGTVATTEVEIGQYLTEDLFASLQLRPLTGLAGTSQSQFAGLRLEWRLADLWTLESFIEDRLARSRLFTATNLSFDKVLGFFIYREWGY